MRLAWFRAAPPTDAAALDATAPLLAALRTRHELHVYTPATAHDFVWTHFRVPYAPCVFELDNTAAHAFIWPYLLHYGGVLLLASPTLHDSRARALVRAGRHDDYAAEFLFNEGRPPRRTQAASEPEGEWPMLRVPLTAARVTAMPYRGLADLLRERYPWARVVHAPLPAPPADGTPARRPDAGGTVVFGLLADDRVDVAGRARARAEALGAAATIATSGSPQGVLRDADVVMTLARGAGGQPLQLARAALAAGAPVIALETVLTADWPALDPQTWRPRGGSPERPIAVTVDLRDEEHSLALAMRRLAADAALRTELVEAARAWCRIHASVPAAVDVWERLLHEAAQLDPVARPEGWPAHLSADGSERARAMLAEFGVTVDLFSDRT